MATNHEVGSSNLSKRAFNFNFEGNLIVVSTMGKNKEKKAKFILEQVQLSLKSRIESSDILVNKAYELLKINITFLMAELAALGAFITSINNSQYIPALLVLIVGTLFACATLKELIAARKFSPVGNQPDNLCEKKYSSQRFSEMILGEVNDYNERFSETIAFNTNAGEKLAKCVNVMLSSPVIAVFIYWVTFWYL